MSVCIGCLVSAVTAGGVWAFGKAHEWHAERERQRAYDEIAPPAAGPREPARPAHEARAAS